MSVYIGMDAHTRSCVYKVKTTEREVLEANSIPATREALLELAREKREFTLNG